MTRIRDRASFDPAVFEKEFEAALRALRSSPATTAAAATVETNSRQDPRLRVVRVWRTNRDRSAWEYDKIRRLRCCVADGTLPAVQVYFYLGDGVGVMLDPRWSVKKSDDEEKYVEMRCAVPAMDALVEAALTGQELSDYKARRRHFVGDNWVYQLIIVAEPPL